jgi:hypothetical protein
MIRICKRNLTLFVTEVPEDLAQIKEGIKERS